MWNVFKKISEFFSPSCSITAKCGHETELKGKVKAFHRDWVTTMPVNEDGSVDYCLECVGKMATRCAWCGEVIPIGDPVTLYTPKDPDFKPRHDDFSVYTHENSKESYVGCLGWDCADSGADRAGFWLPPGEVRRVPTAFEQIAGGADHVIIDDLSKP